MFEATNKDNFRKFDFCFFFYYMGITFITILKQKQVKEILMSF